MSNLVIVDDEQSICWGLARLAKSLNHHADCFSSAEDALRQAPALSPAVLFLDVRLPGMDGLTAIGHFRQVWPHVPIIVMTAYGDLHTAVQAVRCGAMEYVIKPFDLDRIERVLERAMNVTTNLAATPSKTVDAVGGLVGHSPVMQEVYKQIALAANSQANILITGESGTGKELAARAIHDHSLRANGPFVAVNVASLTDTLAESELFGHAKGAFTGADAERTGLLQQADGGTLFLDEVADIPLTTQVKLLRALEYGQFYAVGSHEMVQSDFRVVSATHQDLIEAVQANRFRHDLYFRLAAFRIHLPPLRQREDDIVLLAQHYLNLCSPPANSIHFSESAVAELKTRAWSGNVRELRHAVEHAVIVARSGTIEPEHFPSVEWHSSPGSNQQDTETALIQIVRNWAIHQLAVEPEKLYEQLLQVIEPPLLEAAFQYHGSQYSAAARQLGIHRTTLRKKMDQYGIGESDAC